MALGPHLSPTLFFFFFFVNNVVLEQSCAHWLKGSSLVQADGGKRESNGRCQEMGWRKRQQDLLIDLTWKKESDVRNVSSLSISPGAQD